MKTKLVLVCFLCMISLFAFSDSPNNNCGNSRNGAYRIITSTNIPNTASPSFYLIPGQHLKSITFDYSTCPAGRLTRQESLKWGSIFLGIIIVMFFATCIISDRTSSEYEI